MYNSAVDEKVQFQVDFHTQLKTVIHTVTLRDALHIINNGLCVAGRNLENARDVTRTCSTVSKFNNALSSRVRQRSSVDKNAAQLIDTAVTFKHTHLTLDLRDAADIQRHCDNQYQFIIA